MCQSRLSLNDFLYLELHDSGRKGSGDPAALGSERGALFSAGEVSAGLHPDVRDGL